MRTLHPLELSVEERLLGDVHSEYEEEEEEVHERKRRSTWRSNARSVFEVSSRLGLEEEDLPF